MSDRIGTDEMEPLDWQDFRRYNYQVKLDRASRNRTSRNSTGRNRAGRNCAASPHRTRYRAERSKWRGVFLFIALVLVCALAFAFWNGQFEALARQFLEPQSGRPQIAAQSGRPQIAASPSAALRPSGSSSESGLASYSSPDTSRFTVPVAVTDIADTHYLALINTVHPLTKEIDNRLIISVKNSVPVLLEGVALHKTALGAVRELFAAAQDAGVELNVSSGYRSYSQQQQLYQGATDKSLVQPPNCSEHQTGLAVDIFPTGETESTLASSHAGQWMQKNAWRYGLILRYPEGKQSITGISHEPWHYRYIGMPHAWFCMQDDLCLEEYIQFLKDSGGYQVALDGKEYTVVYQVSQDGLLYMPERGDYTVTSDNSGGYIVTAWE